MRALLLTLPALLLGCTAPTPNLATGVAATAQTSAPFVVPMDPGTITCGDLRNPAAMDVALDWAVGRARAAVLAGTRTGGADPALIRSDLVEFCVNSPAANVAQATGL